MQALQNVRNVGQLNKQGFTKCFKHNENTGSMYAYRTGEVHCFSCGAHYQNAFDVYKELYGGIKEACKALGISKYDTKEKNIDIESIENIKRVLTLFNEYCTRHLTEYVIEYLNKRGITNDSIAQWQIGYCKGNPYQNLLDQELTENEILETKIASKNATQFYNRITIPYIKKTHEIVGVTARRIEENKTPKYINSANSIIFDKSKHLIGEHLLENIDTIYITEGVIDAIIMKQNRYNAISLNGTSISEYQINFILQNYSIIYLVLDNDTAGAKATQKIIHQMISNINYDLHLLKVAIYIGNDPAESLTKDNNINISGICAFEYISNIKKQEISNIYRENSIGKIEYKKWVNKTITEIKSNKIRKDIGRYFMALYRNVQIDLSNILPNIAYIQAQNSLETLYYYTLYKPIDNILKIQEGNVIVIGAGTSVGKTTYMLNIMLNNCMDKDYIQVFFALEMTDTEILGRIKDIKENHHFIKLSNINESNIIIETGICDIENMINRIIFLKDYHRSKRLIIFIDHLHLISGSTASFENSRSFITYVTKRIKNCAQSNEIVIFLAAQLSRELEKAGQSPNLASLRESGSIEQDANAVILLSNPKRLFLRRKNKRVDELTLAEREYVLKLEGILYVDIAKNRTGKSGVIIEFYFRGTRIIHNNKNNGGT